MTTVSGWSKAECGWLRVTSHPIEGTEASFELVEYRDDDSSAEDGAVIELCGELLATSDNLRAAALALLELAD